MKKLLLTCAFLFSVLTFAQKKDLKNLTPEQRVELNFKNLTKALKLDNNQQQAVKEILTARSEKMQSLRGQRKANKEAGKKPTEAERANFKNELEAQRADFDSKMKSILTPEQYSKWVERKAKQKDKLKQIRDAKKNNENLDDDLL
jgi:periplasmic protein CpxP/Spy